MSGSKDHLIDKQIIDVNGRVTTVKVRPNDAPGLTERNGPFHVVPTSAVTMSEPSSMSAEEERLFNERDRQTDWHDLTIRQHAGERNIEAAASSIGVRVETQLGWSTEDADYYPVYSRARVEHKNGILDRIKGAKPSEEWEQRTHLDGSTEVFKNRIVRAELSSAPEAVQKKFRDLNKHKGLILETLALQDKSRNRFNRVSIPDSPETAKEE